MGFKPRTWKLFIAIRGLTPRLHPGDPRLDIPWPHPVTELSLRDGAHSLITADFKGVSV